MLAVFAESVEPETVISLLEWAYQAKYSEFMGNPAPTTRSGLKQTLDELETRFSDRVVVIFPHVDSSGGVYEDLKDFQQARIAALTHPVVRALSFNRQETRDKLVELFKQPDYRRPHPVALIQSSDFHGEEGSLVGQPRIEVLVREGKPTFKNLKDSFREFTRVKCSIDFVSEEYRGLVRGKFVAKYASDPRALAFKDADFDNLSENVCGMLNSRGGFLEIEGNPEPDDAGQSQWSAIRDQLISILHGRLNPPFQPFLFRSFHLSPGKVRVLIQIRASTRLFMANGKVFVNEDGQSRPATPLEVELVASRNLEARFGSRFERTLNSVTRNSNLLSRLPHGIPLMISSERKATLSLPESMNPVEMLPASDKGMDVGETVDELIERQTEEHDFGNPRGNTSLLTGTRMPRERDHYLRFSVPRGDVSEELLQRISSATIEVPTLVFTFGGSVGLLEPGYVICDVPSVLLQLDERWQGSVLGLLTWFKSSFFLWYCAVRLGIPSPFFELQNRPYRLPVPNPEDAEFIRDLGRQAATVISEENGFMDDINRLKKKGTLDAEYREKARHRHNAACNRICLGIDKQIYEFLAVPKSDIRFICETLRDLKWTDFGLLDELDAERSTFRPSDGQ